MLNSLLICEFFAASLTIELSIVKCLLYVAVHVLVEVDRFAALWTLIVAALPVADARSAAYLVAFQALLGVFNNLEADKTVKVVVKSCHCGLRLQPLINLDLLFKQLSFELFDSCWMGYDSFLVNYFNRFYHF